MNTIKNVILTLGLFAIDLSYGMQQPKQSIPTMKKWFERAAHGLEESTGKAAQSKCEEVLRLGELLLAEHVTKVPDLSRPGSFISVKPKMEAAQELLDEMKPKSKSPRK